MLCGCGGFYIKNTILNIMIQLDVKRDDKRKIVWKDNKNENSVEFCEVCEIILWREFCAGVCLGICG